MASKCDSHFHDEGIRQTLDLMASLIYKKDNSTSRKYKSTTDIYTTDTFITDKYITLDPISKTNCS